MDLVMEMLGFAGKGLVVFITFAACTVVLFSRFRAGRSRVSSEGQLEVRQVNQIMTRKIEGLRGAMMAPKDQRKHRKQMAKVAKKGEPDRDKNVFVLDFKGDIMASAVESLREEVTALLGVASEGDEVVVRLESAGGAAHSYGFAASQLARLRDGGLHLTVSIDRVAASGGYMMACVADHIIAAPFAIVGSIGVVAPLPNAHRLLERLGVDYENVTAGKFKRTVSPFAAITEEGRQKFQEQIEEVHTLFKNFVSENRPSLDIDLVATGEHWQGVRAAELGLVNELMTSDDYLMRKLADANIYRLTFRRPKSMRDRISGSVATVAERLLDAVWSRFGAVSNH
jgi:serine protease SohB